MVNGTIEDVSVKESVGYGAIEGILERYIKSEADWNDIKSLKVIGIDEIGLRKGHGNFVTVVTGRDESTEEPRILAVLEGRKKEVVKKFSRYSR